MALAADEPSLLSLLLACCCGGGALGEELYRDWEHHPACQQYVLQRRLGEGGFSEVHLAQDRITGRAVALKVVFLNRGGLTAEQRKILAGEARLLRLVCHPNIVRCLQVLETRRQQVLVLEHLSGGEMLRQLQRVKRYSEATACALFKQVAAAVVYLHSLGILHRDIKPENCLLAKPAAHYASKSKPVKVKVIDLGMAGLHRANKPVHGCMGSPGFIAPEIVLGDAHSPAMDVYSLGVLLFTMLTGRKPWDAQRSHTLAYAAQPTCEAPGLADPVFLALSPPAKQLLLWMLTEDPSRRPSVQQVLGHAWVAQDGRCKTDTSDAAAAAAAAGGASPERLQQHWQVVQQRLQVLSHSRRIMGTARGMMVLHRSGSRSQAAMYHKAVKAARTKLQQQAAALQASGQLTLQLLQPPGPQQQQQQRGQQDDAAGSSGAPATPSLAAGGPAASHASPAASQRESRAAGADDAAPGEPAPARRSTLATVGQLASANLQRHSLLYGALQQQQQQQQVAGGRAAHSSAGGPTSAAGGPPVHTPAAAPPDQLGCALELTRGLSAPNPVPVLLSPDEGGAGRRRLDWAVSMSPSCLALLDVDDQLCLLGAAGTSVEDDESALLAGAAFSWGRRGPADVVASFKQRYPMPARPLVRLAQSMSRSFGAGRLRSPRPASTACYMDAAAAAACASSPSVTAAGAAAEVAGSGGSNSRRQSAQSDEPRPQTEDAAAAAQPAAAPAAAAGDTSSQQRALQHPAKGASAAASSLQQQAHKPRQPSPQPQPQQVQRRLSSAASLEPASYLCAQMSLEDGAEMRQAVEGSSSCPLRGALSGDVGGSAEAFSPGSSLGQACSGSGSRQRGVVTLQRHQRPPLRLQVGGSAAPGGQLTGQPLQRASAFAADDGVSAAAAVVAAGPPSAAPACQGPSNAISRRAFVLLSPSTRGAATAAAARAEEEGTELPNGLWLQASQSLEGSAVARALQLLQRQSSSSSGQHGGGGASGLEQLQHTSSVTSTGTLSPTASNAAAAIPPAEQQAVESAAPAATSGRAEAPPAVAAAAAARSPRLAVQHTSGSETHSRGISMISLMDASGVLSGLSSVAAGDGAEQQQQQQQQGELFCGPADLDFGAAALLEASSSTTGDGTSSSQFAGDPWRLRQQQQQRPPLVVSTVVSRAVGVPWAAHGTRHRSRGRGMQQAAAADNAAAAAAAAGGATTAAGSAGGEQLLPPGAVGSVDGSALAEFYVGSFCAPHGLPPDSSLLALDDEEQQGHQQLGGRRPLSSSSSSSSRVQRGAARSESIELAFEDDSGPCASSAGAAVAEADEVAAEAGAAGHTTGLHARSSLRAPRQAGSSLAAAAAAPASTREAAVAAGLPPHGQGSWGSSVLSGTSPSVGGPLTQQQQPVDECVTVSVAGGSSSRPGGNFAWIAKTVVQAAACTPAFDAFDDGAATGAWYYAGRA